MMRLAGKTAIITGAARGIGRAIALAFAKEGGAVAATDIREEFVAETVECIKQIGGQGIAMRIDVSKKADVQRMVGAVTERFGGVDILVNNAGIFSATVAEAHTEEEWDRLIEEWDRIMAVNLKGPFLCSLGVLESMRERGGGVIINMASMAGKIGGIFASPPYSVSKAGVICLTKALARRWGKYGIRVNGIAPGVIETDMTKEHPESFWIDAPISRKGTPEEVADCAVFLASEEARYLTGEIIDVNGGMYMD